MVYQVRGPIDSVFSDWTDVQIRSGIRYSKSIQHDNLGKDKESNWLPALAGDFSLNFRLYVPQEAVLTGEYQHPPIK